MKKIIFLASGGGGTMRFLYHAIKVFSLDFEISAVISGADCEAQKFAQKMHIPSSIIEISKKSNFVHLISALKKFESDIIVTNINRILPADVLNCTNAKFINLHYSILPSFAGLIDMQTVEKARMQNCQFLGATCHDVNEEVDAGHIICQAAFKANWNERAEKIYDKVFRSGCMAFLNALLIKFSDLKLTQNQNGRDDMQIYLNPDFCFDANLLDEEFWNTVKNTGGGGIIE